MARYVWADKKTEHVLSNQRQNHNYHSQERVETPANHTCSFCKIFKSFFEKNWFILETQLLNTDMPYER